MIFRYVISSIFAGGKPLSILDRCDKIGTYKRRSEEDVAATFDHGSLRVVMSLLGGFLGGFRIWDAPIIARSKWPLRSSSFVVLISNKTNVFLMSFFARYSK